MTGPLRDCRIIELGGMGPAPFASMLLAEIGADVIRVDRPDHTSEFPGDPRLDALNRGKRSIHLDLKTLSGTEALLRLVDCADVLIDPYRPGVTEALGIGPAVCSARNGRLVYARMTGWGQDGPAADRAGHDINYIAVTGALHTIGDVESPRVPLNLIGNFGGGGTYLVIGILAALREVHLTGRGQVIDAAVVDGASHLLTGVHSLMATGTWSDSRESNLIDGGAPFYCVYRTSDDRYVAVGAIESKFYRRLLQILEVDEDPDRQHDRTYWPRVRELFQRRFRAHPLAHWISVFDGTDACVAPVLTLSEAAGHAHLAARGTVVERDGIVHAHAAPRFSLYQTGTRLPPPVPGEHTDVVLAEYGSADGRVSDRTSGSDG